MDRDNVLRMGPAAQAGDEDAAEGLALVEDGTLAIGSARDDNAGGR